MAQFRITIDCDNAAFHDEDGDDLMARNLELARILREVVDALEEGISGNVGWSLADANGNTVGSVRQVP